MPWYRLEFQRRPKKGPPKVRPPEDKLGFCTDLLAANYKAEIRKARERFGRIANDINLGGFVLYVGTRVVHEHVAVKR